MLDGSGCLFYGGLRNRPPRIRITEGLIFADTLLDDSVTLRHVDEEAVPRVMGLREVLLSSSITAGLGVAKWSSGCAREHAFRA